MIEGLIYERFNSRGSIVHLLTIDLEIRKLKPVLAAEAFPFLRVYPVKNAISEGAVAAVGGGFNTVWAHDQGYADQPLHALVVDREIWTTGMGAGGFGVLIGEQKMTMQQNRIRVVVWRPGGSSFEVERINRGHGVRVAAFTARGGTNQRPMEGRHYALLGQPRWWESGGQGTAQSRKMHVLAVGEDEPIAAEGNTVVIETRWPMKLREGDEVNWVQRLGAANVRHIASGWPQIIRDGVNIVPELEMDPEAPDGPDGWFVRENPRMAIGASKSGRTAYLLVVQGRIESSEGLRLKQLAAIMLQKGAHNAVNFDGGGSAFMWTEQRGLVADSTYGDGTLDGLRPDHYSMAVF